SDLNFWIGVFAPAGTPRAVVERLNHAITVALQTQAVRDKLAAQGIEPMTMGAAQFETLVNAEETSIGALAKTLDLKPQ
ncbi:MAG: tripartite tricarboxylate transporter substrate binding protein, partial [Bradyrhizobiaceae bacterium]|nr:tripartite tricarboxylate transporter substrate binding protein [Bradyrhizobiaceae bacterium]